MKDSVDAGNRRENPSGRSDDPDRIWTRKPDWNERRKVQGKEEKNHVRH